MCRLSLSATLLVVASCTAQRSPTPPSAAGQSLDDVYNSARREGIAAAKDTLQHDLQLQGTLGYVRPYVPVRMPPNVMRVWIPPFVDADNHMVQGHWVHVLIRDEQWFIEQEAPVPPPAGLVPHTTTAKTLEDEP